MFSDSTLIPNYFKDRLRIYCNEKALDATLIKQDFQEAEVWMHFSIDLDRLPDSILIENEIFINLFSDQSNMLIISTSKNQHI